MRDPERIPKILKRIEQVWKEHPDMRLGQILECVFIDQDTGHIGCIFGIEDERFITYIEEWNQKHLNKATTQK